MDIRLIRLIKKSITTIARRERSGYFYRVELMGNQNCGLMKNSYPDSLISLSAALAMAGSNPRFKYDNHVAGIKAKDSVILKFNLKQIPLMGRVGIKFDNISAGKYFALINRTQRNPGKEEREQVK